MAGEEETGAFKEGARGPSFEEARSRSGEDDLGPGHRSCCRAIRSEALYVEFLGMCRPSDNSGKWREMTMRVCALTPAFRVTPFPARVQNGCSEDSSEG